MKVLVLSLPRSRSNWAASMLSKYYGVPNLYEPYRALFGLPHDALMHREITEKLSHITDGVLKIEVSQLTDRNNGNKLIDLGLFDWSGFDKIYTTARLSLTDMVCSHRVAYEFDRWVFSPDNPAPNISEMMFYPTDKKSIISMRCCLRDAAVLSHIQAWLTENSIFYTPLHYETIIDYSEKNWMGATQQQYAATEYDYSAIFTNYDQIHTFIKQYKTTYPNRFTL